jgi:hypothetical protein
MLQCNMKSINVTVQKKYAEAARVFFFFPFTLEQAPSGPAHPNPVPMLPAVCGRPREEPATETALADVIARLSNLTAGLLRGPLMPSPLPLTALGHQANLFFYQIAAALAFQQMVRQAASIFGMGWPAAAGPYFPQQTWAAGLWPSPFQHPAWPFPATGPVWPLNLWGNAWPGVNEALAVWAKIWVPAMAQQHPPASSTLSAEPPFTATMSLPGCSWSVTLR